MGTTSTIYRIVLVLHVGAAIVGFGGLFAHGAYNAKAFTARAAEAVAILRTTNAVSKFAHYAIYGVFLLGIVLVALSDSAIGFGDLWISLSFLVWFVIVGVTHGLVRPTQRRLLERAEALEPDLVVSDDEAAMGQARKMALGEGLTQLLLVAALALMVWQPT